MLAPHFGLRRRGALPTIPPLIPGDSSLGQLGRSTVAGFVQIMVALATRDMPTAPRTIWSILVVFLLAAGCATPPRQSDDLSHAEADLLDPVATSEPQPAGGDDSSMEPATSPQQGETADLRGVASSAGPPSGDRVETASSSVVDRSMPTDDQGPPPVAHLWEQEAKPTSDRWYRVLVDEKIGSTQVTQFVGAIPSGRAPDHFHTYEEVLCILSGEGRMWTARCV